MNLRFRFTNESIVSWQKSILSEITKYYKDILNKSIPGIKESWKELISQAIKNCPEYRELVDFGGSLRAELGVVGADKVLDQVINEVIDAIEITPKPFITTVNKLTGGYLINLNLDYNKMLSIEGASYISKPSNVTVEWLKHLLLEGVNFFPSDYRVVFQNTIKSRTGSAVMVKGGSYRVPREFSGTSENNFIIRALGPIAKTLEQSMVEEIKSNVR